MTEHARFLDLAANSVGWGLDEAERRELDAHLRTCSSCRAAMAGYERDELVLRDLVAPRPIVGEVRTRVARAAITRPASRWTLLVAAALLLLGLVGWALLQGGGRTTPLDRLAMAGTWTARHCATHPLGGPGNHAYDCTKWGRDVQLTMTIGAGIAPLVRISNEAGDRCETVREPAASAHVDATRTGGDSGTFLWLVFNAPCDLVPVNADGNTELFHNKFDDEIWDDPDGDDWGLIWTRVSES